MIESTLNTKFIPGTNLQGDLVSADWRFLLPTLQMEKILCLEVPAAANVSVLAAIGTKVVVVSAHNTALDKFSRVCEATGVRNFEFVNVRSLHNLPFEEGIFSLVHFSKRSVTRRLLENAAFQRHVASLVADGGVLHYELRNYVERQLNQSVVERLSAFGFGLPRKFWLTPFKGEMRTALPVADSSISKFFFRNVLFGQSFKKRAMSRAGHGLSTLGMVGKVTPRRSVFIHKNVVVKKKAPPEFLISVAAASGHDISRDRFGLSTRGKYNANKVIYYLFKPRQTEPHAVVKMTRAPEFNYRLQNEFETLQALKDGDFVGADSYPEAMFFETHNGQAMLAQKAVNGVPFRTQTTAQPDCPLAKNALDWLLQLGETSANPALATGSDFARNLGKLYARFCEIYPLSDSEHSFMQQQLEVLEGFEAEVPLVFQHGDPGTWNILATQDNKVIFIDWEAGEPRGIPLWDVFYFLRTYASWVERCKGNKDPLQNFANSFFQESPFTALLSRTLVDYCERIGLAAELIAPLFYTCWMHRALKESTRLNLERITDGQYFNLLKNCIANRGSTGLDEIFSIAPRAVSSKPPRPIASVQN